MKTREITKTVVAKSGKRYTEGDEYGRGARQIRQDGSEWKYYGAYRHVMPVGTEETHEPPLVLKY